MSKRILSICLALAVLLVALPILPIGNMDANAAAPGEANPVFTPAGLPETVVDRVIATFDEEDAQVGQTNYDWQGYYPQYKAYTYSGTNTTKNESIVDGAYKVEFTAFNTANYPTTHVFIDPQTSKHPTTNTSALQFHIDTTGMVSEGLGTELSFRFTLTNSNGTSGVSDIFFVIDNKTWYFLPDATEENPNPEMITMKTRNATSVWNCYLDIPVDVSGTVLLPMDAFFYDENSKVTDYAQGTDRWAQYITDHAATWRHQSSVALNLRDAAAAGDYYILDDFKWLADFPLSYQLKTVTQDFSNFTANPNWTWRYGNCSGYGNSPDDCLPFTAMTCVDGRFVITPASTATDGSRFTVTIDDMGTWKKAYKAFSWDLDTSEAAAAGSMYLRPKMAVRKTIDGTDYATTFCPNGTFYIYNEVDGAVTSFTGDGNSNAQFKLPQGFKGKVFYTQDSMQAYTQTTPDGNPFELTSADTTEMALIFELTNWHAADTGASVYVDNFTYYTDIEGPEAGYNFATDKIGYESNGVIDGTINTVEAWVKTEATTAGSIVADKFHSTKNYADGWESFQVGMNAAGNPVVYLSAGDGDAQYVDWTIDSVTINDGKWNHVAVVVDTEASLVRFYLNGFEAATKELGEFNGVQMARPMVIGHMISNSVGVSNWFDGEIAEVNVWADARTSGEVLLDALQGVASDAEGLLANWALAGSIDETLTAYDLKVTAEDEKYTTYVNEIKEGSYTIAFLPDTQIINLNYSDDVSEFDYFGNIYTWIIDKAEDYNIKAVLSLGDITDKNDTMQEGVTYEWANARAGFDRLTAAGIPWTVVQGNHDYDSLGARHSNAFQEAFPLSSAYNNEGQFVLGGTFYGEAYDALPENQAELSSAYYYLNVDADADYEYMILALEFEPGIGTMEWARQIIQKNSDKKVIITTHGYMDGSATLKHNNTEGQGGYHDALHYTAGASGEDIWNILGKQYANIEMIVCGHLSAPDIVTRVDKGVNGNDVLQVLMDSQGLDASPECPVAIVGLATYNADGTMVSFKYVSTRDYRTETGEGDYFYDDNSNELKFDLTNGASTKDYVDGTIDNAANIEAGGLYDSGVVVRDFQGVFTSGSGWWAYGKNYRGAIFTYTGRPDNANCDMLETVPYTWEAGRIRRGPVAEGNTVYFKGLPNFTPIDGETVKAISIQIENPASVVQYFRISLGVPYLTSNGIEVRNYNDNYTISTKVYLVPANGGNIITGGNSTWATTIPANFAGTMIIPLDNNYCQWGGVNGSGNYIYTAEDFSTDVEGNDVTIQFNSQGSSCKTNEIYFGNIAYHTALETEDGAAIVAPVKDKEGNIIDFAEVKAGETIDQGSLPAVPSKYGMIGKWANVENPAAMATQGLYPTYEKDTSKQYTVTVPEGATVTYPGTQDYALYNDRVVVEAPATNAEGQVFAYWTANGSKFSTSTRISFLAFGDMNMEAVYADAAAEDGVLAYTNTTAITTDNGDTFSMHVMGAVYAPEGTEITEIGVLLTNENADAATIIENYEAEAANVKAMKVASAEANKQFTLTINKIAKGQTRAALTYAVLSDGTVVYGDAVCVATVA